MLTSAGKKRAPFLRTSPPGCFWLIQKPVRVSLRESLSEIFKIMYYEEHLQTAAFENVFMKLKKIFS